MDIDDHSATGNRIQAEVNFRSVSHVSSFVSQAESQMRADVRPTGAEEVGVAGPCAVRHSYPAARGRAWAVLRCVSSLEVSDGQHGLTPFGRLCSSHTVLDKWHQVMLMGKHRGKVIC